MLNVYLVFGTFCWKSYWYGPVKPARSKDVYRYFAWDLGHWAFSLLAFSWMVAFSGINSFILVCQL